ncbi:hypothetical protein H0H92_011698 [Tricholoma furcatifolium]|nr:hypothetical protein H0H92_011698 [Tricholoma furcatifolium]
MERKLVRKLDSRLLPTVVVIHVMNHIDSSDVQYDTVLAMLFVMYILAQVPSNMLLNYVSSQQVTTNYAGALICRLFLGLPEAAFYPGIIYLLSRWYTKKELSKRTALLSAGSAVANVIGNESCHRWKEKGISERGDGFLAMYAADSLHATCKFTSNKQVVPARLRLSQLNEMFMRLTIHSAQPNNTRWLSPSEQRLAQIRMTEDAGEADEDNLEDSPPWALAALICYLNAWHADKTGERFFHVTIWLFSVIIGYVLALSSMSIPGLLVSQQLLSQMLTH